MEDIENQPFPTAVNDEEITLTSESEQTIPMEDEQQRDVIIDNIFVLLDINEFHASVDRFLNLRNMRFGNIVKGIEAGGICNSLRLCCILQRRVVFYRIRVYLYLKKKTLLNILTSTVIFCLGLISSVVIGLKDINHNASDVSAASIYGFVSSIIVAVVSFIGIVNNTVGSDVKVEDLGDDDKKELVDRWDFDISEDQMDMIKTLGEIRSVYLREIRVARLVAAFKKIHDIFYFSNFLKNAFAKLNPEIAEKRIVKVLIADSNSIIEFLKGEAEINWTQLDSLGIKLIVDRLQGLKSGNIFIHLTTSNMSLIVFALNFLLSEYEYTYRHIYSQQLLELSQHPEKIADEQNMKYVFDVLSEFINNSGYVERFDKVYSQILTNHGIVSHESLYLDCEETLQGEASDILSEKNFLIQLNVK